MERGIAYSFEVDQVGARWPRMWPVSARASGRFAESFTMKLAKRVGTERGRWRLSILVDSRWLWPHGIGRFAREVLRRMPAYAEVKNRLPLLHPLEPLWLTKLLYQEKPAVYFSPGFNPR